VSVEPPALSVGGAQAAAFRLARHHLGGDDRADLVSACRAACGIQAQVTSAAYLGLWARVRDTTRARIDDALWRRRVLVKTSAMRGTLHLLTARDLAPCLRALEAGRLRAMRAIMARHGVGPGEADAVRDAVVAALGGGPRTRRELQQEVLSQGVVSRKARPWFERSWWGVVRQPMVEGLVCYGPERGAEPTLVRVERWLGPLPAVEEAEARRELLRRYLNAFGPATLRDFSQWAGLAAPEARAAWDGLAGERVAVSVDGRTASLLRRDLRALATAEPAGDAVRLLPTFDAYLLGHSRKDHLVSAAHYGRVFRKAGWISAVVLRGGVVIGVWSQEERRGRIRLEVRPFQALSRRVRESIEGEAARLAGFLGAPIEVGYRRDATR
jgi:uncharacterized protein YcaQ